MLDDNKMNSVSFISKKWNQEDKWSRRETQAQNLVQMKMTISTSNYISLVITVDTYMNSWVYIWTGIKPSRYEGKNIQLIYNLT